MDDSDTLPDIVLNRPMPTGNNDRVCKKQKLTSDKEKEIDLEKIMDDSDTLPDIVLNRPMPTGNNECLNREEPRLN